MALLAALVATLVTSIAGSQGVATHTLSDDMATQSDVPNSHTLLEHTPCNVFDLSYWNPDSANIWTWRSKPPYVHDIQHLSQYEVKIITFLLENSGTRILNEHGLLVMETPKYSPDIRWNLTTPCDNSAIQVCTTDTIITTSAELYKTNELETVISKLDNYHSSYLQYSTPGQYISIYTYVTWTNWSIVCTLFLMYCIFRCSVCVFGESGYGQYLSHFELDILYSVTWLPSDIFIACVACVRCILNVVSRVYAHHTNILNFLTLYLTQILSFLIVLVRNWLCLLYLVGSYLIIISNFIYHICVSIVCTFVTLTRFMLVFVKYLKYYIVYVCYVSHICSRFAINGISVCLVHLMTALHTCGNILYYAIFMFLTVLGWIIERMYVCSIEIYRNILKYSQIFCHFFKLLVKSDYLLIANFGHCANELICEFLCTLCADFIIYLTYTLTTHVYEANCDIALNDCAIDSSLDFICAPSTDRSFSRSQASKLSTFTIKTNDHISLVHDSCPVPLSSSLFITYGSDKSSDDNVSVSASESTSKTTETAVSGSTNSSSSNSSPSRLTSSGNNGEDDGDDNKRRPTREDMHLDLTIQDDSKEDDEDEEDNILLSSLRSTPMDNIVQTADHSMCCLTSCPRAPSSTNPTVIFRDLNILSYVSVPVSSTDGALLRKDILVSKYFMPEEASDVLLKSIDSGVFLSNISQNRKLTVFLPRKHTISREYDLYHTDEFTEGTVLFQCMNTLLMSHGIHIDVDCQLNACVVEKINDEYPANDIPILPDLLKGHTKDDSPCVILCLGNDQSADLIPKFLSSSASGKIEAGRMLLSHGTAVFLSKHTTKGYQLRYSKDSVGRKETGCSLIITFFCATSLNEDICSDDSVSVSPTNYLGYRYSLQSAYQEALDGCNEATLSKMLMFYDIKYTEDNPELDIKTRLENLIKDYDIIPPVKLVETLVKKMKIIDVRSELSDANLPTNGNVTAGKLRLVQLLTNQQIMHDDTDKSEFSFDPSSPPAFAFNCQSQMTAKDFLKKNPQPRVKRKRASVTSPTPCVPFNSIRDYVAHLNQASTGDLKDDLEYLRLPTDGPDKEKRKRLTNFFTKTVNSPSSVDLTQVDSRLSVLEKACVTICSKLDIIKTDVDKMVLSDTSSTLKQTSKSPNRSVTDIDDKANIEKLSHVVKEIPSLLEKAENSLNDLKTTLHDTENLKKDLITWSESVFKNQDSDRIEEIHSILSAKTKSPAVPKFSNRSSSRFIPQRPAETKTNSYIPGLPHDSPRDSYRRTDMQHPPSHSTRGNNRQRNRPNHKVVLITDSTMQGFCSGNFPKRYDVSVIHKPSFASLKETLSSTLTQITKHAPEAVYIHLGANDVNQGRSPDVIRDDVEVIVETILKETSQSCSIIVSHMIPSMRNQDERVKANFSLSDLIKCSSAVGNIKSTFWKRVSENLNRNFLSNHTPNPDMYRIGDSNHLSERGVRVIMGNLRSSLDKLISG